MRPYICDVCKVLLEQIVTDLASIGTAKIVLFTRKGFDKKGNCVTTPERNEMGAGLCIQRIVTQWADEELEEIMNKRNKSKKKNINEPTKS